MYKIGKNTTPCGGNNVDIAIALLQRRGVAEQIITSGKTLAHFYLY